MTTQEIIKALRCCAAGDCFTACPMWSVPIKSDENENLCCEQYAMRLAADELERLSRTAVPKRHYIRYTDSYGLVVREIQDGWECPVCGACGVENYCQNCGTKMVEEQE